jgi:hypothetical protein
VGAENFLADFGLAVGPTIPGDESPYLRRECHANPRGRRFLTRPLSVQSQPVRECSPAEGSRGDQQLTRAAAGVADPVGGPRADRLHHHPRHRGRCEVPGSPPAPHAGDPVEEEPAGDRPELLGGDPVPGRARRRAADDSDDLRQLPPGAVISAEPCRNSRTDAPGPTDVGMSGGGWAVRRRPRARPAAATAAVVIPSRRPSGAKGRPGAPQLRRHRGGRARRRAPPRRATWRWSRRRGGGAGGFRRRWGGR